MLILVLRTAIMMAAMLSGCLQAGTLDDIRALEAGKNGETYYTLHPQGEEVVELFRARIAHSTREEIRSYAKNAGVDGSPLTEARAIIEKISENRYEVHCQVRDYDRVVLDLLRTASDEKAAYRIRNQWLQKGMSVYWNLLKEIN